MSKLYVVMGFHGEWSDRTEWLVAAYDDEAKAKEHIVRVSEAARVFYALDSDTREERTGGFDCALATPLDAVKGFGSWLEQRYWYEPVELLDEVPS